MAQPLRRDFGGVLYLVRANTLVEIGNRCWCRSLAIVRDVPAFALLETMRQGYYSRYIFCCSQYLCESNRYSSPARSLADASQP